MAVQILVQYIL